MFPLWTDRWRSCRTGPSAWWTCTSTTLSRRRMLDKYTSPWNTTSRTPLWYWGSFRLVSCTKSHMMSRIYPAVSRRCSAWYSGDCVIVSQCVIVPLMSHTIFRRKCPIQCPACYSNHIIRTMSGKCYILFVEQFEVGWILCHIQRTIQVCYFVYLSCFCALNVMFSYCVLICVSYVIFTIYVFSSYILML